MIFFHMANYFRNENIKISQLKKRGLNKNKKILNTRILIIKLKYVFHINY